MTIAFDALLYFVFERWQNLNRMRSEFKRTNGSTYGDELVKTDFYCPNCGKQNVMDEDCDGDYYEGSTMYCLDCKCAFTMPSFKIDDVVKIVS